MVAEGSAANDATAQMLNYALGNLGGKGKQKSWMQAAAPYSPSSGILVNAPQTTERRRGRPPKNTASRPNESPQITGSARPSIEHPAERQPASNSTSPQLANVVTRNDTANQESPHITVFPSPTPSEEHSNSALIAPVREREAAVNASMEQSSSRERGFTEAVQRARIGSKRLSEVSLETTLSQTGKRHHSNQSRQERPEIPANATEHHPPHIQKPPQTRSPQLAHDSRVYPARIPASRPSAAPSRSQTLPNPSRAPAVAGPSRVNSSTALSSLHANVQPTWYTLNECLHVFKGLENSNANPPSHTSGSRRLRVLKSATEAQDWPYLIMHQLYCLADFDPNSLPVELRNMPNLNFAFQVMQIVIDSNNHLSPALRHFFSTYPYPLQQIRASWPTTFNHQVHMFSMFVVKSSGYEHLRHMCERRRFPPIAWELYFYSELRSTTFQSLVFTAILRSMWRGIQPGNSFENRAISLFHESQTHFYQRLACEGAKEGVHSLNMQQGNDSDLHRWGPLLMQIIDEAAQHHHRYSVSHPNTPHPILSSNSSPHQYQVQSQQITQLATAGHNPMSRADRTIPPNSPQPIIQRPRGRPSISLASNPTVPRLESQAQQSAPRPLLPPPGWTQPQQRQPHPARFSLHQANLRSPTLHAHSLESPLYHFVRGFVKVPARLTNAGTAVETWKFSIDAELMRCIAAIVPGTPGEADRRLVDPQSKTFRLRCVKWLNGSPPNDHTWAVTDTSWIPHSYFTLNGSSLQQRKKVHHGKDLPIDITGLLKEGENALQITVMAQSNDTSYRNYLIAVEYLSIMSHSSIKQKCLEKNRISAHDALSRIKQKLSGSSEDDELAIVESNLTINIFDPFSASKICDIPARSRACLHNDCFDLDTFLQTRKRGNGDASASDIWRCPICNADARPHYLIVDGFLQDVKKQLDAQGLSKTRAIIVQQDGSWKPKVEVRDPNGVSDRSTSEPTTPIVTSIPPHAEIIDLSD